MKHQWPVLVLGVVGVALVVAALLGPWWVDDSLQPGGWTITILFGPFGSTQIWGTTSPAFTGWTTGSGIGTLFFAAAGLAAAGLGSGAGMVASVVLSGRKPRLRRWGVALGFIAGFLVLAAALGVMLDLPAALNQQWGYDYYTGFWGSSTYYNHRPPMGYYPDAYGAGWAWYALVAATIFFLTAAWMLFRAQRRLAQQTSPPPAPQP